MGSGAVQAKVVRRELSAWSEIKVFGAHSERRRELFVEDHCPKRVRSEWMVGKPYLGIISGLPVICPQLLLSAKITSYKRFWQLNRPSPARRAPRR
jgi:hypothetical protein